MSKDKSEKTITRIYRNGKSVYQMEFVIKIATTKAGDKFLVTERRAAFRDEKIIFSGEAAAAQEFFKNTISTTVVDKGVLIK